LNSRGTRDILMVSATQVLAVPVASTIAAIDSWRGRTALMIRRYATAAARQLGELVFPPHCVSCRSGLSQRSAGGMCGECIEGLAIFQEPTCQRCGAGQVAQFPGENRCAACGEAKFRFDRATALGPYDNRLRDLLLAAKRPGGAPGAFALGRLLLD